VRPAAFAVLISALALWVAAPASGGVDQTGSVIGSLEAKLNPSALPRERLAPVAVDVSGSFRDASGDPDRLPQLRRIEVLINRGGRIFDGGLPACRAKQIQPSPRAAARRICGASLVGHGSVDVQVRIPGQLPYMIHAPLLAFNGPRRNGHRLILAQTYVGEPVTSFIIEFEVHPRRGLFGTVLSATLPRLARRWAWLTRFQLSLHRTFSYRGQRRSYVAAACALPGGFDGGSFTFARAAYRFAGGTRVTPEALSSCRVAE
jgi:hypothetical protein